MFEEKNISEEEKKMFGEFDQNSPTQKNISPEPAMNIPQEFMRKKKRFPIILLVAIFLLIIIAGGAVLMQSISSLGTIPSNPITTNSNQNLITPQAEPQNQNLNNDQLQPQAQLIDSDHDGLTDEEEKALGTNLNVVDSDDDGLFDFEEVKVYKTDPLNKDTDKDGYSDGEEVKAGYDPKNPARGAKLLNLTNQIEETGSSITP